MNKWMIWGVPLFLETSEYVYDVLSLSLSFSFLSWAGSQVQSAKMDQIQSQICDSNFTCNWIHDIWIELLLSP